MMTSDIPWWDSHRIRLHSFANPIPNFDPDESVDDESSFIAPHPSDNFTFIAPDIRSLPPYTPDREEDPPHQPLFPDLPDWAKSNEADEGSPLAQEDARVQKHLRPARDPSLSADAGDKPSGKKISKGQPPTTDIRFKEETLSAEQATSWFFDISLAGGPIQCSEQDGTCDDMS
jgi:hypothetical protein